MGRMARKRFSSKAPLCIGKTRRGKRCTKPTNNDNGLCGQCEGVDANAVEAPAFIVPAGTAAPIKMLLEDIELPTDKHQRVELAAASNDSHVLDLLSSTTPADWDLQAAVAANHHTAPQTLETMAHNAQKHIMEANFTTVSIETFASLAETISAISSNPQSPIGEAEALNAGPRFGIAVNAIAANIVVNAAIAQDVEREGLDEDVYREEKTRLLGPARRAAGAAQRSIAESLTTLSNHARQQRR